MPAVAVRAPEACELGLSRKSFRELGNGLENSRLRSAYAERQRARANEHTKQPQRDRVLEHILKHHAAGTSMRLFSTPGLYWPFEKQLADAWPGEIDFVAVEWNWPIIELGVPHMPGAGRPRSLEMETTIGSVKYVTRGSCKWVWSYASSFLSMRNKEIGKGNQTKRWSGSFRYITAAWLDLNTNFSDELLDSAGSMSFNLDRSRERVPIAVSFVMGQEHIAGSFSEASTSLGKRVPRIVERLNANQYWEFELTDQWQYESERGAHMGNLMGVLHNRYQLDHP